MQKLPNSFEGAVVKPGGGGLGPDETGISLVCVERKNAPLLYGEYTEIFADNGNDFGFVIGRFGYGDRASAGSTSPYLRYRFNKVEIEYLKSILIPFFCDVESLKEWSFFPIRGRPLLGVRFSEDWIIEKPEDN